MAKSKFWRPYSTKAALIRSFIPDIRRTLALSPGLQLRASVKKHLRLFRGETLRREVETAQAIAQNAPADGTIYDIGANIGLYTLVFGQNRRRHVVSFEPFDQALRYLRENLTLNNLTNVDVHSILLSDHVGECRFTLDEITMYTSHVSAPGEPGTDMPCADLDSYAEKEGLPQPDLVKMDVEGHDEAILRGMEGVLQRSRPVVYLEGGLRDDNGRIGAITNLERLGYTIWDLTKQRRLNAYTPDYDFLAFPE